MKPTKPKPDWWPECPYPKDIFPMTIDELVKVIPDPKTRTAVSGCLGRFFWNMTAEYIWQKWCEKMEGEG